MTEIEVIWSRLAEGYRRVARDLSYELLETTQNDWKTSFTCVDFWFRQGTYLDLSGSIVLEGQPPGIAPGFNAAQFRTFVRDGDLREIYTVAVPEPQPRAFGFNAWFSQTVLAPLCRWLPEEFRGMPMKQPTDLATVDQRHRQRVGNVQAVVGDDPLELRWALHEELEEE